MKENFWVFHSISSLLLANLLLGQHCWIGLFLCFLWIWRIFCLRNKSLCKQSIFWVLFFLLILFQHQTQNRTELKGDENFFLLSLDRVSLRIDGDQLSFTGKVIQSKDKVDREKINVRYYIQTEKEKEEWLSMDPPFTLMVKGELNYPSDHRNFNQFNYRRYLRRRKIHWQLNAEELRVVKTKYNRISFTEKVNNLRFKIIDYMDNKFDKTIGNYLKKLFMADHSAIPNQTKEDYRALGLIHLFSISGFHISYLVRVVKRFFLRMGLSHEASNFILIILLPFYGLLAGLSISVFRAITQETVKIFSLLLNKEVDSLEAWSLAMMASLVINPYSIFEISFQLSYGLSGIFILMSKRKWIEELTSQKQALLYSVIASIFTMPFLAYHFFEVSWLTIFSNLLFVPFFSLFLFPALFILLLMSVFLSNTTFFLFFNKIIAFILIKMEHFFSLMTNKYDFSFVIGRLPHLVSLFLFITIIYILQRIEKRKKVSLLAPVLFLIAINWNHLSPLGYVLILDVGQGDSILIKEPLTKKITLIDTGGKVDWQKKEPWQERDKNFTIGEDIVVPSLKSLGISKIDRLYISHAHVDHMGEIKNISRKLDIKEIAVEKQSLADESFQQQLIGMKNTRLIKVNAMTKVEYPTINTSILHPIVDYQAKNNQSLVLYVKIGEDDWLFTGDLEKEGEKDLIQSFPSLKIDYLKVGHHGSLTSSTKDFIKRIEPSAAFISVGENNSYDHPSSEVLDYFREKEIDTYLTANDGAIKINYFKVPVLNKWLTKIETVNKD